jgi:hypothetical protein
MTENKRTTEGFKKLGFNTLDLTKMNLDKLVLTKKPAPPPSQKPSFRASQFVWNTFDPNGQNNVKCSDQTLSPIGEEFLWTGIYKIETGR